MPVRGRARGRYPLRGAAYKPDIVRARRRRYVPGRAFAAPANSVAPAVTGTPTEGQTLTCSTGTWTGYPDPSFSYQWQRDSGGFANITGATSSTYLLDALDVGANIRCVVTGTNVAGSASANSNQVGPIAGGGGAVRRFDGTDDVLTVDNGLTFGFATGAYSFVLLVKPTTLAANECFVGLRDSVPSLLASIYDAGGGEISFKDANETVTTSGLGVTAGDWQIIGISKTAGTSTPRAHRWKLGVGSMTHANFSGTVTGTTNAVVRIDFGANNTADFKDMTLAVGAMWTTALSDADFESIVDSLGDLDALNPDHLWRFNQASAATSVDDLIGNGADQTALTGTVVVGVDDPPGWSFNLAHLVAAGQATETELAQPITHRFTRGIGQATETDSTLAPTILKTRAVGQATAANTALAITARKTRAVGLPTETDTPQPLQGHITRTLGQAAETETAQSITGFAVHRTGAGRVIPVGSRGRERGRFPLRGAAWRPPAIVSRSFAGSESGVTVVTTVAVGQATETDTALNLIFSAKHIAVGQATETDAVFKILRSRRYRSGFPFPFDSILAGPFVVAGQAAETDAALAATHRKTKAIGQALDTESAQSISAVGAKTINVGQVAETDASLAATHRKTRAVGLNAETDTAQAFTHRKTVTLGLAAETEAAQTVRPARVKAVGLATETDSALAATRVKSHTLGQTLEFESSQAHRRVKRKAVGHTPEDDTARPVTITGNDVIVVEIATNTQTAFSIAHSKRAAVGLPQENETAFPSTPRKTVAIGLAAETDTVFDIASSPLHTRVIGIASETDSAMQITRLGSVRVYEAITTGTVRRAQAGTATGGKAGTAIKGGVLVS